jgi:nitric oxide synthase oxygenase domain/subunit
VEFVAKLPRTGFCVTNCDVIPLTVDVENNSTRVIQMRARIMKRVSLFVQDYEDVSKEIMTEITSEPIQPRSSYMWNPTNWVIPPLTPTLLFSRIIHADYILEVSAVIPNAINMSCDISLLMGNLPFESSGPNLEDVLLGAIVMAMVQGRSSA